MFYEMQTFWNMSLEQGVEILLKEKKDRSDGNKSLLRGGLVHDVELRQISWFA